MTGCRNCSSYAVNDDPGRLLCDKCWRDRIIADLVSQVAGLEIENVKLRKAVRKTADLEATNARLRARLPRRYK